MVAVVTGIGWVATNSLGRGREFSIIDNPDGMLPKLTSRMLFGRTSVHFGRLDQYSKLGVAAITYALRDAGLEDWTQKRPIGIIASSVYGCLTTDIDFYATVRSLEPAFPSPNLFAYTLPNVYLGEAATMFGLTGQTFVMNEPVLSGLVALRMALMSIETGACDTMLVGVCDQGHPDGFTSDVQDDAGALFIVIRDAETQGGLSYGNITMEPDGRILFASSEVKGIQMIRNMCVQGLR